MSPDQFRVGVIGTGIGLRTHVAGFGLLDDVQVVGVVGRSVDRAKVLLHDLGEDESLACTLDDLLAQNPDLVCLTTPPAEREAYETRLAETNASLLIEKPVAITGSGAESLLDLYQGDGRRVYVDFQLRGLHAFQSISEMIRNGEFGKLYSLRLRERTSAFRRDHVAQWQQSQQTGGGQRLAMGCHLLDLGIYLGGLSYEHTLTGAECGNMATPRGSWRSAAGDIANPADEVFRATVNASGCWIDMLTTAVSSGPRLVEVDIEGTEGAASFLFRNGSGSFDVNRASGEASSYALLQDGSLSAPGAPAPEMNPSLFRVAFPNYAREVVNAIKQESSGSNLATLSDGVENARILDNLVGIADAGG